MIAFKNIISKSFVRLCKPMQKINILKDNRGVAAIEFALVFPILLMIYLGCIELTRGVNANRKVTLLVRTLADLTAQQTAPCSNSSIPTPCISDSNISDFFNAAAPTLYPYPANDSNLKMAISMVHIAKDASDNLHAYTIWSAANNAANATNFIRPCDPANSNPVAPAYLHSSASPSTGDLTTLPSQFTDKSQGATEGYLIVSDVKYTFWGDKIKMFQWTSSGINMQQSQFMNTRSGTLIASYMHNYAFADPTAGTTMSTPGLKECAFNPK